MNSNNLRYIADFEKGNKVFILDRYNPSEIIIIDHDDFVKMDWIDNYGIGNLIIEGAHCRFSNKSKAQKKRWKSEKEIKKWWKICEEKGIELRLWPEKVTYAARLRSRVMKSGENDIRAISDEFERRPYLWNTCQKVKNVRFHDRSISFENHVKNNTLTNELALFEYKNKVNEDIQEKTAEGLNLKDTIPGKILLQDNLLNRIYNRLNKHTNTNLNENSIKIVNGIGYLTIDDITYEYKLSDVFNLQKAKKGSGFSKGAINDYLFYLILTIVNLEGKIYYNEFTGKMISLKEAKQYPLGFTPFHNQGGNLRAKFMYYLTKRSFVKNIAKEILKIEKLDLYIREDEIRYNQTHDKVRNFGMKFARIACEVAWKEMHSYIKNGEDKKIFSLEKFFNEEKKEEEFA